MNKRSVRNSCLLGAFLWLLSSQLTLSGCGGEDSPPGLPPPPLSPLSNAVAEALADLRPEEAHLESPVSAELRTAANQAFSGNFALEGPARARIASSWPSSASALAGLLIDDSVSGALRAQVLQFASTLGGRALAALCRHALEGRPDQAVEPRRLAVWLLGEYGEEQDVPALLLRLKYEEYDDPVALVGAARALARHRNLAGVPYLAPRLSDPATREQVTLQLAEISGWEEVGLGQPPEKQVSLLLEPWRNEGRSRRDGRSGPNPALVRALLVRLDRCRLFNLRFRDDAVFILERAGWHSREALAVGLVEANRDIRVAAVETLRNLGPVGLPLGEKLAGLLRDPLTGLYAIESIGAIGWKEGTAYLLRLAVHTAPDLRQAALLALGRVRAQAALPLLEEALADPARAPEEHLAAALSLGLLGNEQRARELLEKMADRPEVHRETLDHYLEELDGAAH